MTRHPDDAALVAFLDEEMDSTAYAEVRAHLASCWYCRRRRAQAEHQISEVARIFSAASFTRQASAPAPGTCPEPPARRPVKAPGPFSWFRWGVALASAALVAAASAIWIEGTAPAPRAVTPKPPAARPGPATLPTPPPPAPPKTRARIEVIPEPLERTALAPTFDLDEVEVAARYALFRAGADLGEPFDLRREGGHIVVAGVIEPAGRREVIEAALAEVEGVRTALVPAGAGNVPAPVDVSETVVAERPDIEPALRDYLARHGYKQSPVEFSNRIIELTFRALDHAWALRRLEQAFPPERAQNLSRSASWLLEAMAVSHLEAARRQLEEVDHELRPLLIERLGNRPIPEPPSMSLLELADHASRAVTSLLGASAAAGRDSSLDLAVRALTCLSGLDPAAAQAGRRWNSQRALRRRTP